MNMQFTLFDNDPALSQVSLDGSMTPWEMDFGMMGKYSYRAEDPVSLKEGEKLVASTIYKRELTIPARVMRDYGLGNNPSRQFAFRVSVIANKEGATYAQVERMAGDHRVGGDQVLARFEPISTDLLENRVMDPVNNYARQFWEKHGRNYVAQVVEKAKQPAVENAPQSGDLDLYARKIASWEERASRFGNERILDEARNAVAGQVLGREFGESTDTFYAKKPQLRATRDWVLEKLGRGTSEELAKARATVLESSFPRDPALVPGTKEVAQRQVNAIEKFIVSATEQFGLTRADASAAWDYFVKNKLVKIDALGGQFNITDGRLWDGDALRRAANIQLNGQSESRDNLANPITPDDAANFTSGTIVRDVEGREYLALSARHDWMDVAPIVDGKPQVSRDTVIRMHLNLETASASPERRADPMFITGKNLYERVQTQEAKTNQLGGEAFEHCGYTIYPSAMRNEPEKKVWLLQSQDNKERGVTGFGDEIYPTVDEAKNGAERQQARQERDAAFKSREASERAAAEAKVEANRGLSIVERKANAVLDKPANATNFGLGNGTLRDIIYAAVEQGRAILAVEVDDSAARKRDGETMERGRRKGWILGYSNANLPDVMKMQEASDRLKADKYTKPEYRIYADGNREGSFIEINKTAYTYAQSLLVKNIEQANGKQTAVAAHVMNVGLSLFQNTEPYQTHEKEPDIYAGRSQRPGTTDKQRRLGRDAYKEVLSPYARRAGVSLLGSRIAAGFASPAGGAALIGQEANSPEDLALLAQIVRDPRFETFRFFFTQQDKIVGHTGVTSRLPGQVTIVTTLPGESNEDSMQRLQRELKRQMDAVGADGYWLLHNHPSGRATPSPADERITVALAEGLEGFKGHVVVDHNEYAVIDQNGEYVLHQRDLPQQCDRDIYEVPHNALNQSMLNSSEVANVGKMIERRNGFFTLIGRSPDGRTSAIAEAPTALLTQDNDNKRLYVTLKRFAVQTGSTNIVAVCGAEQMELLQPLVASGLLMDVVDIETRTARGAHISARETIVPSGELFENIVKAIKAQDQKVCYDTARVGAVSEGMYSGKVLKVENGLVSQKTGRNPDQITVHHAHKLTRIPAKGEVIDICYQNGIGRVAERQLGVARGR